LKSILGPLTIFKIQALYRKKSPPPSKKEGEINVLQKTSLEVLNPAELLELEVSLEQVYS
jgi:hypothetical protein